MDGPRLAGLAAMSEKRRQMKTGGQESINQNRHASPRRTDRRLILPTPASTASTARTLNPPQRLALGWLNGPHYAQIQERNQRHVPP